MKVKFALALAAVGSFYSTGAIAQDVQPSGFYLGAQVGIANVGETDVQYYDAGGTFGGSGTTDTVDSTFDFDGAITFGGVIGYDFGAIRTDIEVNYAKNDVSSFTVVGVNGAARTIDAENRADFCDYLEADTCGGSGNTFVIDGSRAQQLNAMANIWGEIPLGPITPYAGGGIGIGGFEVDGEGAAKFTWQLGAGAALNLSPGLSITADYRHRQVGGTTIEWDANSGINVGDVKTDTFTLGLRVYL